MVTRANVTAPMGAAIEGQFRQRLTQVQPVEVDGRAIETPEQRQERLQRADTGRLRAWEQMCPPKYASARLDALTADEHPDKARGWLDSDAMTLLMVGGEGAGKSFTAHAIGHAAIERGMSVASYNVVSLKRLLLPGADENLPARTMTRCTDWDLLILDDLGQEKTSEWVAEIIYSIVEARTGEDAEGKRTIITTNLTSSTLAQRYGSPVLGRIEHNAAIARFEGTSKRAPSEVW